MAVLTKYGHQNVVSLVVLTEWPYEPSTFVGKCIGVLLGSKRLAVITRRSRSCQHNIITSFWHSAGTQKFAVGFV